MRFVKIVMEGVLNLMNDIEQLRNKFEEEYCVLFNGKPVLNDKFFSAIEKFVKDRESIAFTHGMLSSEAHQKDITKTRIEILAWAIDKDFKQIKDAITQLKEELDE